MLRPKPQRGVAGFRVAAPRLAMSVASTLAQGEADPLEQLKEAAIALKRLESTRTELARQAAGTHMGCADQDVLLRVASERLTSSAHAAFDDDVHTPSALAALFEFQRTANTILDRITPSTPVGSHAARDALAAMEGIARILTLFDKPVVNKFAYPLGEVLREPKLTIHDGAKSLVEIGIEQCRKAWRDAMPKLMGVEVAP